ncbi:sialate O-acetylesterase [Larkinella soli]|uniref:sialate O-acetylesterase n=1 Tax=Larkinella soli TaxID=1770527 RepID=UPI000FFBCFAF|nr:sialate O-acetylesterase [Larkinella soli]
MASSSLKTALCLLLMNVLTASVGRAQFPPAGTQKVHLYLLVGQSNMAGRGTPEPADRQPHPHIWVLNRENRWVPAADPLHFDKPDVIGVGPGLTFAREMAKADTSVWIGLIPAAAGGSPIDAWQPGGYHDQTKSHPYDDALLRARLAQKDGTLKGILWHQGESDSKPELAPAYEAKLIRLIGRFRRELNAPDVPVVVGTLGDFWVARNPAAGPINETLRGLPGKVSRLACVDAAGLTDKGDHTHFDTPSARELGRRYAAALRKLESYKP